MKQIDKVVEGTGTVGGAVVGGVGGAAGGALIGTMFCPGVGTAVGACLPAAAGKLVTGTRKATTACK